MINAGRRGKRAPDGTGFLSTAEHFNQQNFLVPTVTSFQITDGSYVPTDDLAVDTAGGQTIVINGSGFAPGATVQVGATTISVVTFVDSNRLSFTAPTLSSGSYTIYVTNANGGTGILVPGLVYSGLPTFSTSAGSLASLYETTSLNTSVSATGDAPITYSLYSGSLPEGITLNSDGTITGTSPVDGSSTTYSFTIKASDAELQDSTRSFSLTINTDVVNWSSPSANGTVYTAYEYVPFSNVVMSASSAAGYSANNFSANTLPTGLTLSGNTISGTVNTVGNTDTRITATSSTTNRTSVRDVVFNVAPDIVTWNTPTENYSISTYEYSAISNVTVDATSVVGFGMLYSANTTPDGLSLNVSSGLISGTPTTVGTTYAQLTATANTTNRTNTRNVVYTVNQDVVTWSTPTADAVYTLTGGAEISNVSLSATSAAGKTISYTANSLPTGLTLSGNTIYGTPTTGETIYTALTATADTTNRTAVRYVSWTVSLGDSFWKNTTTLLSADSATQKPNFIIDNSINNTNLTVAGDAAAKDFNPYQHGYYSNYFDGTGDYLSLTNNTALNPGTGTFTLEMWVYFESIVNNASLYRGHNNGLELFVGTNRIAVGHANITTPLIDTVDLVARKWYHFAVVRSGTTMSLYKDGTRVATTSSSTTNFVADSSTTIGQNGPAGGYYHKGYISNVRLVIGTAVYDPTLSTLTVPTTPLTAIANTTLLTCHSNSLDDKSPINSTITRNGDTKVSPSNPFSNIYQAGTQYYSNKFDGTGDYLRVAASSAFSYGTGDFTYEAWIYPTAFGEAGVYRFICGSGASGQQDQFLINNDSSGKIYYYDGASGQQTTNTLTLNAWNHVAVSRSSGTLRVFINGVQGASVASSTNITIGATNPFYIGNRSGGADSPQQSFIGNISNVRVVKGTGLYTGNFTPSTSPLTAISGTSLLTCQDSTIKDNSTNAFTITAGGDVKPLAVSPFTPSSYSNTEITTYGSGYFDGTGDYLSVPSTPGLAIGQNSATIEFWIYPTNISGYQRIITATIGAFTTGAFVVRFNNGTFLAGDTGSNTITSSTMPVLNAWNHIAWVGVSGSTQTLYINGVNVGTSTTYNLTTAIQWIGGYYTTGPAEYTNGYIADVRVTKGTALYTSNFVPQFTSTLSNTTNTQLLTLQYNGSHNNSTFKDSSGFNNLITRGGNATQGTFSPYGDNWSVLMNTAAGGATNIGLPATTNNTTGTTGDFTVECWAMKLGNSSFMVLAMISGTTTPFSRFQSAGNATGLANFTTAQANHTVFAPYGTWFHIAACRHNGTLYTYINGVMVSSAANSTAYTLNGGSGSTRAQIGAYNNGANQEWVGSVSNFRIVNGTALYPNGTTFTPSTSPLTAVANTICLTCQSNRFVDNSPKNATLTITGTPTVQKFSPFSTLTLSKYYSTYFDGSGDQLNYNTSVPITTGPFTIEFWMYPTLSSTSQSLVDNSYWNIGDDAGWNVYLNNDNTISLNASVGTYNNFPNVIKSSSTITMNKWTHVSIVRNSSNQINIYFNGVVAATPVTYASTLNTGNVSLDGRLFFRLGRHIADGTTYDQYAGYLADVRVVDGTAIIPPSGGPTSSLTAVSNTKALTCQSSTIVDNSGLTYTVTTSGNTKPLLFSPYTPTPSLSKTYSKEIFSGSVYFDGTGDYLTIPASSMISGSSAYTIEFWVYRTAAGTVSRLFEKGTNTTDFSMDLSTAGVLSINNNTTITGSSSTLSVPLNAWTHVALVRTSTGSNDTRWYINGVDAGAFTHSVDMTDNVLCYVMSSAGSSYFLTGYISDLKITKGVAVYNSNFYPGTTPLTPTTTIGTSTYTSSLLLNGTNGGIIDASRTLDLETVDNVRVSNFTPYSGNYYSNYFDGTGDYLQTPATGQPTMTGDFTVSAWVWLNAYDANRSWIINNYGTSGTAIWGMSVGSSGGLQIWYDSFSTSKISGAAGQVPLATWTHIAFTRSGSTITSYVNGVAFGTTGTKSTTFGSATVALTIGAYAAGQLMNGYISNLRILDGVVDTTVPTNPYTNISGVKLLTCQDIALKDNSTNNYTITRTGDVKVAPQNPFLVNSGISYYFDGTGDYMKFSNAGQYTIFQGDFTIECWLYYDAASITNYAGIIGADSGSFVAAYALSTNKLECGIWGTSAIVTSSTSIPTRQWVHVALVRSSGVIRWYINGIQDSATATNTSTLTAVNPTIGSNPTANWNGYIADLRITKGPARYTANTTVSTSPLLLK